MKHQFLYRALRKIEIDANHTLIPKGTGEFKSDPMFGIDTTFDMVFNSEENAIRQHQWMQNGLPTRGVSTTPIYERAVNYARTHKVIVKIDTSLFDKLGIKMYDVNEVLGFRPSDIAAYDDHEIILVYEKDGQFPREIISEIITIKQEARL